MACGIIDFGHFALPPERRHFAVSCNAAFLNLDSMVQSGDFHLLAPTAPRNSTKLCHFAATLVLCDRVHKFAK